MKKFILALSFFLFLLFNINIIPSMGVSRIVKKGFYTLDDLKLSPNSNYTVQNNSFNERAYILVFDSEQNFIQALRLRPQSLKYDLIPLQKDYKIVVVGNGEVLIS
jgi:hypothetical protein